MRSAEPKENIAATSASTDRHGSGAWGGILGLGVSQHCPAPAGLLAVQPVTNLVFAVIARAVRRKRAWTMAREQAPHS